MNFRLRSARNLSGNIIFVTGTDTGVGKTVLAALLLVYLLRSGVRALAIKPFCCGGRADVDLLCALQAGALDAAEVNPYYFAETVAPLVAARKHRRQVSLPEVLAHIHAVAARCDCLIVEGCGGLQVPLGEQYTVADLIGQLECQVVVVGRDQLGTINHTLLTVTALQGLGIRQLQVALMRQRQPDLAARSNQRVLARWLAPVKVWSVPYLGPHAASAKAAKKNQKKVKKVLAHLVPIDRI